MLVCPKPTTHLHKFRQDSRMYVADLSQCLVLEINNITCELVGSNGTNQRCNH